MARIDEAKKPGGEGRTGQSITWNSRTVAAFGVVAAIVIGIGVWWGTANSGVELERGSEVAEEPVDPEVVEDVEVAEGEGDADAPADAGVEVSEAAPAVAKVHVDGAVLVPGVYELYGEDPRVADAVAAAGGLADGADTSAMNLAAQVRDGDKVHIPQVEEHAKEVPGVGEIPAGSSTVSTEPSSAVAEGGGGSGSASGPININTASAEELTALPGVGEKTAEKIVADREAQGPFASPEDLMRVSGIGEKKFAQVRDLICV